MPTRADFEAAAETFLAASRQLAGVTASVAHASAGEILHGGLLGRVVPERIASSSASAQTCQTLIHEAAATCSFRASVIADYEIQLARYDRSNYIYQQRIRDWRSEYNLWWSSDGEMAHPGQRPVPPRKPAAPPAWAEVRRL